MVLESVGVAFEGDHVGVVDEAVDHAEAYRKFHAGEEDVWMPLGQLGERTEVLAEQWADLASAFSG